MSKERSMSAWVGVAPLIGAGSLDGFAIGALASGACFLAVTASRRARKRHALALSDGPALVPRPHQARLSEHVLAAEAFPADAERLAQPDMLDLRHPDQEGRPGIRRGADFPRGPGWPGGPDVPRRPRRTSGADVPRRARRTGGADVPRGAGRPNGRKLSQPAPAAGRSAPRPRVARPRILRPRGRGSGGRPPRRSVPGR